MSGNVEIMEALRRELEQCRVSGECRTRYYYLTSTFLEHYCVYLCLQY